MVHPAHHTDPVLDLESEHFSQCSDPLGIASCDSYDLRIKLVSFFKENLHDQNHPERSYQIIKDALSSYYQCSREQFDERNTMILFQKTMSHFLPLFHSRKSDPVQVEQCFILMCEFIHHEIAALDPEKFDPFDLSLSLEMLCKFPENSHIKSKLLSSYIALIPNHIETARPPALAGYIYGLSLWHFPPHEVKELTEALVIKLATNFEELTARRIGDIVYAASTAGITDETAIDTIYKMIAHVDMLGPQNVKLLTACFTAMGKFAMLGDEQRVVAASILQKIGSEIQALSSANITNIVYSIGQLNLDDHASLQTFHNLTLKITQEKAPTPRALSQILLGYGLLRVQDDTAHHLVKETFNLLKKDLRALNAKDIGQSLSAYRLLSTDSLDEPSTWFHIISRLLEPDIQASSRELHQALLTLYKLDPQNTIAPALTAQTTERFIEQIDNQDMRDHCNFLVGISDLTAPPLHAAPLMDIILTHINQHYDELAVQQKTGGVLLSILAECDPSLINHEPLIEKAQQELTTHRSSASIEHLLAGIFWSQSFAQDQTYPTHKSLLYLQELTERMHHISLDEKAICIEYIEHKYKHMTHLHGIIDRVYDDVLHQLPHATCSAYALNNFLYGISLLNLEDKRVPRIRDVCISAIAYQAHSTRPRILSQALSSIKNIKDIHKQTIAAIHTIIDAVIAQPDDLDAYHAANIVHALAEMNIQNPDLAIRIDDLVEIFASKPHASLISRALLLYSLGQLNMTSLNNHPSLDSILEGTIDSLQEAPPHILVNILTGLSGLEVIDDRYLTYAEVVFNLFYKSSASASLYQRSSAILSMAYIGCIDQTTVDEAVALAFDTLRSTNQTYSKLFSSIAYALVDLDTNACRAFIEECSPLIDASRDEISHNEWNRWTAACTASDTLLSQESMACAKRVLALTPPPARSDFERSIEETLLSLGIPFATGIQVHGYCPDFIIKDKDRTIALECDGERFHYLQGSIEAGENLSTRIRNRVLKKSGFEVVILTDASWVAHQHSDSARQELLCKLLKLTPHIA